MAVPFRFIRSRNPNTTLRGALKVNAIFATDNAPGTEPFQGWLADNTVVTSFNDALIENEIGVVDTNEFNPNQSNRFAFTTMSEGQEIDQKNLVLVEFQNPIDPTASTFNKGDILEFVSNAQPFGTLDAPSEGKSYRIFGTLREKDVRVEGALISGPDVEGFYTITLNTDPRENLQAFTQATSTGLNIQIGDSVVIFNNQTALNGTSTSLNGTYVLTGVTPTSIEYKTNVNPLAGGDSFQSGGRFYKIQNELLLTEVLRAEAAGLSYNAGDTQLQLATAATLRGTVVVGQVVTGPGIEPETIIISYSNTTKVATLANLQSPPANPIITTSQGGVTVNFTLENPQNDIVIPDGANAALTSPLSFVNAGSVVDSRVIKLPTNYYVYGDARLKYFWASYNPTGTLQGWDQNIIPDGIETLYNSGIVSSGATEQLIGTDPVVDDEDTFNNAIKTLGITRGTGIGGDYTSTGRAALLYISATDSQGGVGSPGGGNKSRSTSTPGYTVRETIDIINTAGGYWIGVVGGSFFQDNGETCQNEIRPFRKDSSDGILGDPRGFTPLKGEVVTARIGNPIAQSEDNAAGDPVGTTRVTTYYDHALGNPGDQIRVRIKNNTNASFVSRGADGLVDVVVVDDKNFYFISTFGTPATITPSGSFDEMGYVLNVTQLLNVPLGFYRKSTFEYVDPTLVNDSRSVVASGADGFTLSEQPGVGTGLDRKEILVTLQITQTTGTLQFFSSYPVGDFFLNLPATDAFGEPYFAYPIDSDRDIKFKVKTQNNGGEPFTTIRDTANVTGSDLLDPGNNTQADVTPGEEIPILLYPIEYTAIVQSATGDVLTIPNSSIEFLDTPNSQLARDFTSLTTGGAGYDDGSGDTPNDFSATNVATTGGGNNDLTVDIVVESGAVTEVTLNERGTGYSPGDVLNIEANVGGTVVTKATITLKTITDWTEDWTIEIIDTDYLSAGDDFFENTDNWTNPGSLISKTRLPIANISDNGNGTTDLTLLTPSGGAGAVTGNPVNSRIAFCYPRNDKQLNVFVKTTNNFKDISITDAQFNALEAEQPGKGATDVSVTFTGYGYSKGDILTPSEITNPPVDITSAVWNRETEITEDGFTFVGASISGTTLYEKGNLAGDQQGSGAAFNVRNTVTGLYAVELSDSGADFQIGERIIIPGYELGGSNVPRSVELLTEGSGASANASFTGQPSSATTGSGSGLTFNFTTNSTGGVDPATLQINSSSATGYNIGDEGEILLAGATVNPTYKITGTENDLIITVREIANNSNVTLVTTTPHGFVPSLGRTTVDIVVKDVVASGAPVGNFNGRKIAQIVGSTTLKYDQLDDPGTYVSGGQVINVSPDVINDSFAVYANKLFLNLNTDSNDPVYPYLRFIQSATINQATTPDTITITTTEPHLLTTGDEVAISNIVSDRGANWNTAKSIITVTGSDTFTYQKDVAQSGNAVSSTGEVTNPYVKVLGGVYTKDFFRIVFVNTDNTTQDGILPDKTQDFLVRDINFKQISNDNNDVKDGDEHYFYVTSGNEIIIINKISSPTTITPIFESSEYEVVTSTPHGLLPGNKIDITIATSDGGPVADYNTPGGAADPDVVTAVPDSTTFRYKIFTADRTLNATPVSANVTGTVEKLIGRGSAFEDTYFGPSGGVAQDIVKLKNLKGFPGVNSNDEYYLVTVNETNQSGTTEYIRLQLAPTKSGSPIVWQLDIVSATYDKTTENAIIEVTSSSPHNLGVGDQVSITGVSSDDYNGIQTLTENPISPTIFTYQVPPLSADPDPVSETSIDIFTTTSTAPRLVTKRCNSFSNEVLEIRSGGGRTRAAEGIVPGMEVTGPGINTGTNGRAYVQSFVASTRQIILQDSSGNPYVTSTSQGGGGQDFDFESGTATSFAIALDQNTTNLDDIAVGQFINGTGIANNSTKITSIYDSSVEVEAQGPTYYYITIDTPLSQDLSAGNNPFTLSDNLQGGQSLRVTNVLPSGSVPKIGAEIETVNGSGNVLPGGTLVTDVVTTTSGGFIISVDSNLLIDFTDQEIRIFPDTNAGTGGKVSPVIVPIIGSPPEPENPDTSFGGTIQLTADIAGWDHVSLARETGGAIFFQLGFSDLATGSFNSNTITTNSNISSNLTSAIYGDDGDPVNSPVGIGVYGDGIAPGAIITSVVGQTITLDKPNVGVVNGYVGFARPDSVSVFPKYTSEFGRILGKTFAEWLFKIA